MAKISDIKSIIKNMTAQSVPANTTTTGAVQYPVKATTTAVKPEVHDVDPVQPPTYTVQPVVTNNQKEEAKAPAATTVVSVASPTAAMLPDKVAVDAFVRRFVPGVDIMSIPGIPKPILTKAGAVKVIKFFGVHTNITLLDKTVDPAQEFISYTFKVSAISNGECIYEAIGCANSHEPKFKGKGMGSDPTVSQVAVKRATVSVATWLLAR